MNKTLFLLRGVPGAGKTSLAKMLATAFGGQAFAADDYFYQDGQYIFDRTKLGVAHKNCRDKVLGAMQDNAPCVVVHNTLTGEADLVPYMDMAKEYGYRIVSLVVENRHGNSSVHNVPQDTLANMEKTLLNNLKLL